MKILTEIICAMLFYIGGMDKDKAWFKGWDKKGARIIALPVFLAITLSFYYHNAWLVLEALTLQSLRIGYGEDSFLSKIFRYPWIRRGAAGLIYGLSGVTIAGMSKAISFDNALIYLSVNTLIGGVLDYLTAPVWIIEPLVGAGVASLIILCQVVK